MAIIRRATTTVTEQSRQRTQTAVESFREDNGRKSFDPCTYVNKPIFVTTTVDVKDVNVGDILKNRNNRLRTALRLLEKGTRIFRGIKNIDSINIFSEASAIFFSQIKTAEGRALTQIMFRFLGLEPHLAQMKRASPAQFSQLETTVNRMGQEVKRGGFNRNTFEPDVVRLSTNILSSAVNPL